MQIEKLRSLIREAVDTQLKEIEAVAEAAAMDARLAEYDKAIKTCESKIQAAENLEEVKDLMDENKINELKKKLKSLTKAKEKLEKQKAKKNKGKEVTTDAETDKEETVDEGPYSQNNNMGDDIENANVDETYTMDEMEMSDEEKEELKKKAEANDKEYNIMNESFLKMQKLAGVITEAQYNQKKKILIEAIGDFNAPGFAASIKENLKKMGYEVTDMKGSSIDSAKGDLEKAANEGKNSAVVGVLEWEDGEEVVAAISLNQKEKDGGMAQQKELKAKIHDLYAKDFTTRFNVGNNGRVLVIGIKDKK
jgi:hypothetical protein